MNSRYFHQKTYDVAIVGGGIVGLATAKELKKRNPNLNCIVLEKEDSLGKISDFLQLYGISIYWVQFRLF